MFCQLAELRKCRTEKKFIEALHSLPETLTETYHRIIDRLDDESQEHALRSLAWIAFALRPPRTIEVAEAAVLNLEDDQLLKAEGRFFNPESDILDILGSMVTVRQYPKRSMYPLFDQRRPKREVVQLAHFTVKEYILDRWATRSGRDVDGILWSADLFMAKSCLRYTLYSFRQMGNLSIPYPGEFPLFDYATRSWFRHEAVLTGCQKQQLEALKTELLTKPESFRKWRNTYHSDCLLLDSTMLHYAAHHGCLSLVQEVLDQGMDVTVRNSLGRTPVDLAAEAGHNELVRVLMDKIGSELEMRSDFGSPLYWACSGGRADTAELILQYLTPTLTWERTKYSPLRKLSFDFYISDPDRDPSRFQ